MADFPSYILGDSILVLRVRKVEDDPLIYQPFIDLIALQLEALRLAFHLKKAFWRDCGMSSKT